jgi:hypothetical protein
MLDEVVHLRESREVKRNSRGFLQNPVPRVARDRVFLLVPVLGAGAIPLQCAGRSIPVRKRKTWIWLA